MSMQTEVSRRLDAAANSEEPVGKLIVNSDADQAEIALIAVDSIGCAFDYLCYRTPRLNDLTDLQLRNLGEQLAQRITYLMEPIRTVEIDGQGATLQLRSERPQEHASGKRYYEVFARPGSLLLCRYEKPSEGPRKRVPAHVTREVVLRLIEDFAQAGQA